MNVYLLTDNLQDEAILTTVLRAAGMSVHVKHDLGQVLAKWTERPADFLMVALRLPDPLAAVQSIRQLAIVPLIIIVDPVSEDLHIEMVEAGADWVIERPYPVRKLIAYSKAFLRRAHDVPRATLPTLEHEAIKLDPGRRTVQVQGRKPQRLSQLEFRLLHTLMIHQGQVIPTDMIVEHVWGYSGEGDRSLVRGLVNRVRAKIEENPTQPQYIRTVPRVGYIFGLEPD